MKPYLILAIASILFGGCKKDQTDFTQGYPGTYQVWGTRVISGNDSAAVLPVTDTFEVLKVNNETISLNGVELRYQAANDFGDPRFERKESDTYSRLGRDPHYPDSIYYYHSHSDEVNGSYYMDLHGGRIY
jgi:hypothetical protein